MLSTAVLALTAYHAGKRAGRLEGEVAGYLRATATHIRATVEAVESLRCEARR